MMKFVTHNEDKSIEPWGTSLVGEVRCSYYDIVSLFGKPGKGDGYKIDAEWYIKFEDGVVATIYDWKVGKNYNGKKNGVSPKDQYDYDWHIGGMDNRAKEYIESCIKQVKHVGHMNILSKEDITLLKKNLKQYNFKSIIPAIKTYPITIGIMFIPDLKIGVLAPVKQPTTEEIKWDDLINTSNVEELVFDHLI